LDLKNSLIHLITLDKTENMESVKESLQPALDYWKKVEEQSDPIALRDAEKAIEYWKKEYEKEQKLKAIKDGFICGNCDYLTELCHCKQNKS